MNVPATTAKTAEARSTNAERSAATKARLLDATLECLVELGWSGTSTTEVVRRAGVSRGAQVHHFPSKEDLVLAAVEHLQQRRLEEYLTAFRGMQPRQRTPQAAFDLLRSLGTGPVFDAWLELVTAARTQPALRHRFAEASERFWQSALEVNRELFPETAADADFNRVALRFAFTVADGLSIQRLSGAEPSELEAVAEAFKDLVAPFFPSTQGANDDGDRD